MSHFVQHYVIISCVHLLLEDNKIHFIEMLLLLLLVSITFFYFVLFIVSLIFFPLIISVIARMNYNPTIYMSCNKRAVFIENE